MKIDKAIWLLIGAVICALFFVGLFSIIVTESAFGWVLLVLALGLAAWIVVG